MVSVCVNEGVRLWSTVPSEIIIEFRRARRSVLLQTGDVERYKMAGCYRCVFEVGGWSLNLCLCVCGTKGLCITHVIALVCVCV